MVSGDGVRPRGVLASLPTSFVIDTREAGLADLDVVIQVCNNRHCNELNDLCCVITMHLFMF